LRGRVECIGGSLEISDDVMVASGSEMFSLNQAIIKIDKGVKIGRASLISATGKCIVSIGENTTFYSQVFISGPITIGADCMFGPNITILTGTHVAKDRRPIRVQDAEYLEKHGSAPENPVVIGDDCWIGVNAVILPGVNLGKGCVVGAGAVVTDSFAEYSIIGGVPARLIGQR